MVDKKLHWERVYETKAPEAVSWYKPHLDKSLELILRALGNREAAIIDVGGGEATLVDDLQTVGYHNVSVLDISEKAIAVCKERLGAMAAQVTWWNADILEANLPQGFYDLWHDRAVFHFLTCAQERCEYVRQLSGAVKPGGYVILSTFGQDGPQKCSGLDTMRYNAESLQAELGEGFRLIESQIELHNTPFGTTQQFLYCCFRFEGQK